MKAVGRHFGRCGTLGTARDGGDRSATAWAQVAQVIDDASRVLAEAYWEIPYKKASERRYTPPLAELCVALH